jgi:hypothetical protein
MPMVLIEMAILTYPFAQLLGGGDPGLACLVGHRWGFCGRQVPDSSPQRWRGSAGHGAHVAVHAGDHQGRQLGPFRKGRLCDGA